LGAKDEDADHIGTASSGQAINQVYEGSTTLVLSSRDRESAVVGRANGVERLIKNAVIEVHDGTDRLGLEAGDDFPVHRWEVRERIRAGGRPVAH
jgi:sRNA-binding carbon storage regulator CsrA